MFYRQDTSRLEAAAVETGLLRAKMSSIAASKREASQSSQKGASKESFVCVLPTSV